MSETDWRTTSFAQRLEHVRVNLLNESYAGFRRRLIGDEDEKDGFDVHYNSVINYHTHTERADKRREPSLEYVMRVCQVLDIRPAWLLFGEGKPTAAEMATDASPGADPAIDAVTAAIINELGAVGLNAGVRWVPLAFLASGFIEEEGGPWSIAPTIGRLARALRAPLDSLGIDPAHVKMLDTYLALVGIALEGALRNAAASNDYAPTPDQEG
jgi:hypothetical protein